MVNFCNENTNLIGKGRAFDIAYLGFRKAFKAACSKILIERMWSMDWMSRARSTENWLNSWAQRAVISGRSLVRGQWLALYPWGRYWIWSSPLQHLHKWSGWWGRLCPQQVRIWHKTERKGWYARGLCPVLGSLVQKGVGATEESQLREGPQQRWRNWSTFAVKRGWKSQGELFNMYKYLQGRHKEKGDQWFSVVPCDRARDNGHELKYRRFLLDISQKKIPQKRCFLWEWLSMGMDFPRAFLSLDPWR